MRYLSLSKAASTSFTKGESESMQTVNTLIMIPEKHATYAYYID